MKKEQVVDFIPMSERLPEDFEACVIVDKKGRLSVGCWLARNSENTEGVFRQGRNGVYEKDGVAAWIPIEDYRLAKGGKITLYYPED